MKEKQMIAKPMTIARECLFNDIVELCNGCGLPFFVIEGVLKELTAQVHDASIRQLELDRRRYEKACAEAENDNPQET